MTFSPASAAAAAVSSHEKEFEAIFDVPTPQKNIAGLSCHVMSCHKKTKNGFSGHEKRKKERGKAARRVNFVTGLI